VRLEAVLANEDALLPGEYPVFLQVLGPEGRRVWEREVTVKVPGPDKAPEQPFAALVLDAQATFYGPAGEYRFLAGFAEGAAAAGGETRFHLSDAAGMPAVDFPVTLWGEDGILGSWLRSHGATLSPAASVILCGQTPPGDGGEEATAAAFADLVSRIHAGATAICLCPSVFAQGEDPLRWLPVEPKGALECRASWLYLKDEWARRHPIFDGLPAGGIMDLAVYREVMPDPIFAGLAEPDEAVAGAINAAQGYLSGLIVAVYRLGAGRLVLNTFRIRENLGLNPAAERLLRNMLRFAAAPR
jgi:hypothetical protein